MASTTDTEKGKEKAPRVDLVSPECDDERSKLKEKAEKILDYCGVEAIRKEEILKKMDKYIDDRDGGKLSEITGDEKWLINDAIHGPIELTPLIFQIINTKEFHRLKNLRQQGATHYVYPGANHTRFEHSIGVYHIAGVFARSLKKQLEQDIDKAEEEDKKLYKFEEEEILCAEIAGLCHDLGHGPMSHMFESVMKESLDNIDVEHEKISVSMFKRLITHHEVLGEFVLRKLTRDSVELIECMISPPSEKMRKERQRPFLYEIVANKDTGIDVDKWDYYQRDCHYLGILQDFEWKRTMLLGRIVMTSDKGEKMLHVGFRDKEMDNLYGMFRTRANLYRKACKHKTVKAVERMFIDAMVLVKDLEIVWAPSDRGPGSFKSIKEAVKRATNDKPELDWYMSMTDSIVDIIMSARCKESDTESTKLGLEEAKYLLTRIEQRDLYKCVAKVRVPKFGPLVEYMKEEHVKHNDEEVRMAKKLKKDPLTRRDFIKNVYQHLMSQGKLLSFKEEDMLVEVITIKHPSEEEKNPLDNVFIFEKPKGPNRPPEVLDHKDARKKASMVMVPQAFVEYEVRVYDKRCKDKRSEENIDQAKIQAAMEKALKELRAPKEKEAEEATPKSSSSMSSGNHTSQDS